MSSSEAKKAGGPNAVGSSLSRFTELFKTLQFAWFSGHVVVLVMSSLYVLSLRGSSGFHQVLYSLLYLGVLGSFGIIVYQHHFKTGQKQQEQGQQKAQPKAQLSVKELVQDENFLYCLLAVLWLVTPRFFMTIPPFFIFSAFHALTYVKSVFLPVVFSCDDQNATVQFISSFLRENHNKSLSWSCTSELLCFVVVIVRAVAWRRRSWIVLVLYSLFVKARYERSANMRAVLRKWEVRLDGIVSHPSVPPRLKQVYASSKMQLRKLSNYSLTSGLFSSRSSPAAAPSSSKKD
ncbi:nucleoporin POM33 Ecym_6207 [Eremothecium cymbalariae DBVPG|uniref:Nucleoporin POM33 n=1 Tax=Eremothecium cymbalariae (strain CBS 270.75 / DBVPG 7215 / KCTC 17166 / NRRL Y-17582) TaxID=931890 RepID=G8JVB1_ERECY|nr:hypothetical protein Ecym_6207 [Eremothecium cymbalariae DBVPG\